MKPVLCRSKILPKIWAESLNAYESQPNTRSVWRLSWLFLMLRDPVVSRPRYARFVWCPFSPSGRLCLVVLVGGNLAHHVNTAPQFSPACQCLTEGSQGWASPCSGYPGLRCSSCAWNKCHATDLSSVLPVALVRVPACESQGWAELPMPKWTRVAQRGSCPVCTAWTGHSDFRLKNKVLWRYPEGWVSWNISGIT